ncbi:hypothetical protein C8F04DRAFT_668024 [Mycena alexandri]|uniref:Uncharacterized protein n=1 Tax=Mycena alexandri TaxID=1745969 RepID=A0AAD6WYG6_9AGAR|nr:hypothetical protein C8F04DRAFT_668024 [Mycena alexandri]
MMLLITCLFEHLFPLIAEGSPLDQALATDLLLHAGQLLEGITFQRHYRMNSRCINAAYRLCTTSNLSSRAKLATLRLLRILYIDENVQIEHINVTDATWIHSLLAEANHLQVPVEDVIADLLQILWHCRPNFGKVTPASLRTILGALIGKYGRGYHAASNILCSADNWFLDIDLGPILEVQSIQIWSVLMSNPNCIILGAKLSHLTKWKLVISQDLPGCLNLYDGSWFVDNLHREPFQSLLCRVWDVNDGLFRAFREEEVNAIRFTLLAKEWNSVALSNFLDRVRHQQNLKLLRCTVWVMLSARLAHSHKELHQPSQSFKDTIILSLGEALGAAGKRVKAAIGFEANIDQRQLDALIFAADLLLRMGLLVNGELQNPTETTQWVWEYWKGLKDAFLADINRLREMWEEEDED